MYSRQADSTAAGSIPCELTAAGKNGGARAWPASARAVSDEWGNALALWPLAAVSSVAVLSSAEEWPENWTRPWARFVSSVADVSADDDAVVFHGPAAGQQVRELREFLGQKMPPAVVLTTEPDAKDAIVALHSGALGYLTTERLESLEVVVRTTAAGMSCLDPQLIAPLVQEVVNRSVSLRDLTLLENPTKGAEKNFCAAEKLTARERQVMDQIAAGRTVVETAQSLRLAEKTVRNYLNNIFNKLGVRRQSEAILLWLKNVP